MRTFFAIGLLLVAFALFLGAGSAFAAETKYELWVPNQADDQINIYSSDRFQVLTTIDVSAGGFAKGAKPHLVAFSPSGKYAFVTNVGAKADTNNVTVIRAVDRKIVAQLPTVASAHATAFSSDGNRVWIYNTAANQITEILADEAAEKWTVGRAIKLGIRPVLGAFTPDNAYNLVTLGGNADNLGGLAMVNVATGKVEDQIEAGREAVGAVLSNDKQRLYATVGFHAKNPVEMNDRLYVFDPTTRALMQSIKLDGIKDSHILGEMSNEPFYTKTHGTRQFVTAHGKYAFWTLRGQPQTGDPFALKGKTPGVEVYDTAARKFVTFIPMPNGDPHGVAVYMPQRVPALLPTTGAPLLQSGLVLAVIGIVVLAVGVLLQRYSSHTR